MIEGKVEFPGLFSYFELIKNINHRIVRMTFGHIYTLFLLSLPHIVNKTYPNQVHTVKKQQLQKR